MVAPKKASNAAGGGNVKVVVRIRPLSGRETDRGCKESITEMQSEYGVEATASSGPEVLQVNKDKWFEFDAVLGHQCTQKDVYVRSGSSRAITEDIFKGYNVTLLAYGQTGAGKTFTMGTFGDANDENAGILPRGVEELFETIQSKCDGNGKVELSYLEIYNEEIRDLLSDKTPINPEKKSPVPLKIRETLNGEVYVSGLTATEVSTAKEIGDLMEVASSRRVTASTAMNAVSSRSHAICSFKVSGVLEGGEKFTSKLALVDLAGSERIKKTGAMGSRQLEGIHINKSLMTLGQVVSALADGGRRKPPYRDSKLTRLLQDSLGGNSRTIMLACVSPADYNIEESSNTLRYATSARNIKNTATRNLVQQISQEEALVLRRENQLLKQRVTELQENLKKLSQIQVPAEPTQESGSSSNGSSANGVAAGMAGDRRVDLLKRELSVAAIEVSHAAIEVPALHMEIAQLKESLAEKAKVEKENMDLRQELEFSKADAKGARVAAAKLQEVMDQLKELKQDEVNKKQVILKHKHKEKEWVDFVARILDRRTDQLKQLQLDFELVIKVVESPAVYQTQESKNWFGRNQLKEVYDPELREQVLREHCAFFKDRMDDIQNDIFVRAISLQGIRDRIDTQCSRMEQEIDLVQEEADGIDNKESDLLGKLVDMLISDPTEDL
mmetsp:Transcript_20102/g.33351  ORF Transcript_20102/g.33351 Transcript_20102/m.33351 type:complete len:671 (+) Transcript_20102:27-2039(+)|eukprot:CAMPEP_0119021400 /NCGR_PEP_ID=MMETSP1176-20130426/25917_1 /TAXON_ID=265551 /ORGANISM="Synedropsis recta cf, Strain CCMP1620" /LENGTH=670 /DNA_ID=CAMNT_0006975999 /DNA_START=10 /DNA_END=2022 /DNA_ORIENTATION=-